MNNDIQFKEWNYRGYKITKKLNPISYFVVIDAIVIEEQNYINIKNRIDSLLEIKRINRLARFGYNHKYYKFFYHFESKLKDGTKLSITHYTGRILVVLNGEELYDLPERYFVNSYWKEHPLYKHMGDENYTLSLNNTVHINNIEHRLFDFHFKNLLRTYSQNN